MGHPSWPIVNGVVAETSQGEVWWCVGLRVVECFTIVPRGGSACVDVRVGDMYGLSGACECVEVIACGTWVFGGELRR